jgi:hypothetical protein
MQGIDFSPAMKVLDYFFSEYKFQASLGYIVTPYLKTKQKKKVITNHHKKYTNSKILKHCKS